MNIHPFQAMANEIQRQSTVARAATIQMTLGKFMDVLRTLPPRTVIKGLGRLTSYRGSYDQLAFVPTVDEYEPHPDTGIRRFVRTAVPETQAHALLSVCEAAMGRTFEGYKGGDYVMHENTPLWVSPWGDVSNLMLMGVKELDGYYIPVTEQDEY